MPHLNCASDDSLASSDWSVAYMDASINRSNQELAGNGNGSHSSSRQIPHERKKRKCLRLDVRHHRNIFRTTFYIIWMYRKRHVMLSLLQILVPALILTGMTAYLGTLLKVERKGWSRFPILTEQDLYHKISDGNNQSIITLFMEHRDTVFARKYKSELEKILQEANTQLEVIHDKNEVVQKAIRYHLKGEPEKFIGGIEIKNPSADSPNKVNGIGENFDLSFTTVMAHKVPGFDFEHRPFFFDLDKNQPNNYYQLLGIELAICRAFYALLKNDAEPKTRELTNSTNASDVDIGTDTEIGSRGVSIKVQSMSYPPHETYILKEANHQDMDESNDKDQKKDELDSMLSTIFVLSMVPVFFTVVEGPVTEKEKGFKLYLQLMGFPRGAYWFCWILNQMIIQLLVIIMQTCLIFSPLHLNTGKLVRYGDWRLWSLILLMFNFSCMGCFTFIAAFFRRGKMATYIGILIWLLSFHVLQQYLPALDFGSGFAPFMISCLIPSGSIYWAIFILETISTYSNTWDVSIFFALTQKSGFSLLHVMLAMIINFFMYFFLTLYVDNLYPGPLESAQPWNYFFEGIRCRYIDPNKDIAFPNNGPFSLEEDEACRNCPNSADCCHRPVIEFQNLSKKFHLVGGIYGIENVKFTVYSERITVLLGHKDSGKTTLMRLICGEYAPTSGTVLVNGYNVRRDAQKVQSYLSVCLQKDLLCDYLTVMEHMQLIGKLKGLNSAEAKRQSKIILESVGLLSQGNDPMWRLVKFQRRVLCVAMALLGNSPILLLDQPTSDLDIDVKRQIWSLLNELKRRGKTILMSTNDIEEAYQIGDRIVIMSRGKVAGVGTPSRLEKLFETGYHLDLEVQPDSTKDNQILTFLQERIPTIRQLEGSLTQVRKAINYADWDIKSQANKSERHSSSATGEHRKRSSTKKFSLESNPAGTQALTNTSPMAPAKLSRISQNFEKIGFLDKSLSTENCYLLPANEKARFANLFRDLDQPINAQRLGIKRYELIHHDVEKAFMEVDDYVDVLDATERPPEEEDEDSNWDDFEDKKALKLLISDSKFPPLPETHKDNGEQEAVYGWKKSLWAMVVKRLHYSCGNYQQAIVQILAPVVIAVIIIQSTNIYFHQRIILPEIALNASTELSAPIVVPYRMLVKDSANADSAASGLLQAFKKVIQRSPNNIQKLYNIGVDSFETKYDQSNEYKFDDELIIAADFTEMNNVSQTVTALFSPYRYHSAPLSLLLMFNAILDYEFPNGKHKLQMSGKLIEDSTEWMFLLNSSLTEKIVDRGVDITLTVAFAFGYFIFTSGFVIQPCAERLSKLKRYQMYALRWNGVYWIAFALVDLMFNTILVIMLTLTVYYLPNHHLFRHPQFIILFVLTTTFGGFASVIASYYWSHYLINSETSYYATLSINQFLGLFIFLFYTIINFDRFGPYAGYFVSFCLQIIQPFTIPWNFFTAISWTLDGGRCAVLNKMVIKEMCSRQADNYANIKDIRKNCCEEQERDWSFSFIWNSTKLLINVGILIGHCIALVLTLMYLESKRLRRSFYFMLKHHSDKPPALKDEKDAEAIKKEEELVAKIGELEAQERKKYFVVQNLSTTTFQRVILQPMSFVAEPGKFTAIVGPETSGLTVLYEILSGIRAVSEGRVTYGGYSLLSHGTRKKFLHQLGLCPVLPISIDKLTGLQLLKLFGRLRGIPSENLDEHTDFWIQSLSMHKKINKKCESYSAVMKKKLGVSLAAIGNPSVLIFDEPMRDLDPLSKAQIQRVLESLVNAKRTVIVLTHRLANVQTLCNKLVVVVNGQMQFCANTDQMYQELATEFCVGIKLMLEIDFHTYITFKNNFEKEMENMTLLKEESHFLEYRVKSEKYRWANLFEIMEEILNKYSKIIQDYHIRRVCLEDVYDGYKLRQRVLRSAPSTWEEFRETYC